MAGTFCFKTAPEIAVQADHPTDINRWSLYLLS